MSSFEQVVSLHFCDLSQQISEALLMRMEMGLGIAEDRFANKGF